MKLNNKHKINPYKFTKSKYSTHGIIFDLVESIEKGSLVLDVGCNDGYLGREFKEKLVFYGIDYMENSVNEAKKYYKDALHYDLNNLVDLKWNVKFDAIIFGDVLEHLIDAPSVLQFFVKNYLNSKGKVVVSLPNVANIGIRIKLLFGKFDYTNTGILDKTHLHLYTYSTAKNLLKDSGLKIVREYGGSGMFGKVMSVLPFLKGLLAHNIVLYCEY